MPFDPPFDRPLHYRLTTENTRAGRTSHAVNDFSVTFRRGADGLTLSVAYVIPANVPHGSASAILLRPIAFRLDQNGHIAAIADETAYWTDINRALERIMQTPGRTREDEALVARLRGVQALPEGERAEMIAVRIGRILDYANRSVQPEANVESTVGGQIYDQRIVREDLADGSVRITARVTPRAQSGFRFQSQETSLVSSRTGLVSRWEERRRVQEEAGGVVQTNRILELMP